MPSRVFTQLDVTGVVNGFNGSLVEVNATLTPTFTNFGNFRLDFTGNDINPSGIATSRAAGQYTVSGIIGFTSGVNPIPATALIIEVRVRNPVNTNLQADADQVGFICDTSIQLSVPNEDADYPAPPRLQVAIDDSTLSSASSDYINTISGSDADTIFDFSSAPIDLTELQSLFGTYVRFILLDVQGQTTANPVASTVDIIGFAEADDWELEVTWIEAFSWTLHQPNEPLVPGVIVQATSPAINNPNDAEPVDFTQVTEINMNYEDENGDPVVVDVPDFEPIDENLIEIEIPDFEEEDGPAIVEIELISTQFDGSVAQQLYTTFFVSASGVYQFNLTKTNDELYIEGSLTQETIRVKIPNPYGKTGFFGK